VRSPTIVTSSDFDHEDELTLYWQLSSESPRLLGVATKNGSTLRHGIPASCPLGTKCHKKGKLAVYKIEEATEEARS
jgi:hypothetical protein